MLFVSYMWDTKLMDSKPIEFSMGIDEAPHVCDLNVVAAYWGFKSCTSSLVHSAWVPTRSLVYAFCFWVCYMFGNLDLVYGVWDLSLVRQA